MPEEIRKDRIDVYLKALANEFKRVTGRKVKAEIVIVGGGSVMLNYDFRMNSVDIDAFNTSEEAIKTASLRVAEKYGLPDDWLNDDFKKTKSYSPKLREHSVYYKTYANVLEFRTVNREYLIAMKMVSGRKYKNDLSDIMGILYHHYLKQDEISLAEIEKAVRDLYGGFDSVSEETRSFVEAAINGRAFIGGYEKQKESERAIKERLIIFQDRYPAVAAPDNIDEIISKLERL